MSNNTLRTRISNNVLNRRTSFTTTQVSRGARASLRHTQRVVAELVANGLVVRLNTTTYKTL